MKTLILIAGFFFNIYSSAQNKNANTKADTGLNNIKVEGKCIITANNIRYKTTLYDLKILGQFNEANSKSPYFIMSGRDCINCDENVSIFIWNPQYGPMQKSGTQKLYSYPGRQKDYSTNKLIYENRMFIGSSSKYGNSVIWLQNTMNKKWEKSAFIVLMIGKELDEITLTNAKEINALNKLLNSYKEIKGIETTSEP